MSHDTSQHVTSFLTVLSSEIGHVTQVTRYLYIYIYIIIIIIIIINSNIINNNNIIIIIFIIINL